VYGEWKKIDVEATEADVADNFSGQRTYITSGLENFKNGLLKVQLGKVNVTSMNFKGCSALTSFAVSNGLTNTSSLTTLSGSFGNCSLLKNLDLRFMDTSNVTDFSDFMKREIASITVSGAGTTGVNGTYLPFEGLPSELTVKQNTTIYKKGGFYLYQLPLPDNSWRIDQNSEEDNRYYRNPATTDNPPKSGWLQASEGAGPSPTLAYSAEQGSMVVKGLHSLNISSATTLADMFDNVTFNSDELGRTYIAWANNTFGTTPSTLTFDAGSTQYPTGSTADSPNDSPATDLVVDARTTLDTTKSWTITDGGVIS
jgi:hypothetical protein